MFDCPYCLKKLEISSRAELFHERKCFSAKERAEYEREIATKQDRLLREAWVRNYGKERPW
jgi:hypothetical protein